MRRLVQVCLDQLGLRIRLYRTSQEAQVLPLLMDLLSHILRYIWHSTVQPASLINAGKGVIYITILLLPYHQTISRRFLLIRTLLHMMDLRPKQASMTLGLVTRTDLAMALLHRIWFPTPIQMAYQPGVLLFLTPWDLLTIQS